MLENGITMGSVIENWKTVLLGLSVGFAIALTTCGKKTLLPDSMVRWNSMYDDVVAWLKDKFPGDFHIIPVIMVTFFWPVLTVIFVLFIFALYWIGLFVANIYNVYLIKLLLWIGFNPEIFDLFGVDLSNQNWGDSVRMQIFTLSEFLGLVFGLVLLYITHSVTVISEYVAVRLYDRGRNADK